MSLADELKTLTMMDYLKLREEEWNLPGNQILGKEELNLNLYVRKKTNNLQNFDYLKTLKKDVFWQEFKSLKLWRPRTPEPTSEQLYHAFYTKVYVPQIDFATIVKLIKKVLKIEEKKGYFFINRYNSKYPFTFQGLYLLTQHEFKKSLKYIKTTPIYLSEKMKDKQIKLKQLKQQKSSLDKNKSTSDFSSSQLNILKNLLSSSNNNNNDDHQTPLYYVSPCQDILNKLNLSNPLDQLFFDFYKKNQLSMAQIYTSQEKLLRKRKKRLFKEAAQLIKRVSIKNSYIMNESEVKVINVLSQTPPQEKNTSSNQISKKKSSTLNTLKKKVQTSPDDSVSSKPSKKSVKSNVIRRQAIVVNVDVI